ncbi:MAG: aminoglycoside phosphotransferase family protein [Anaerolineae bacterium]
MLSIPADFARRMIELHGQAGAGWLRRLPAIVARCARRWSLRVLPPFEPLSYNYVAPATGAGGAALVLKVGYPHPELLAEIAALQLFKGRGIVRLLAADPGQGALLLEHLRPGQPLATLPDDERATAIAAGVMRRLWRPAPPPGHPFPTVQQWAAGLKRLRHHFDGGSGPFPPRLVAAAEIHFAELAASAAEPVLLHGDLHHHNILSAEREPWLALDPKGLVGEPAYEAGALLRNPLPQLLVQPEPGRILTRRATQLAEMLGLDRERLIAWGMAQAVLSAWWSFEDHGHGWEGAIAVAQLLVTAK